MYQTTRSTKFTTSKVITNFYLQDIYVNVLNKWHFLFIKSLAVLRGRHFVVISGIKHEFRPNALTLRLFFKYYVLDLMPNRTAIYYLQ